MWSKYQPNCGGEYGPQTSLGIGRKPDKHEVAVIEPRVMSIYMAKFNAVTHTHRMTQSNPMAKLTAFFKY